MKKQTLLTFCLASIIALSCKKETPAEPVVSAPENTAVENKETSAAVQIDTFKMVFDDLPEKLIGCGVNLTEENLDPEKNTYLFLSSETNCHVVINGEVIDFGKIDWVKDATGKTMAATFGNQKYKIAINLEVAPFGENQESTSVKGTFSATDLANNQTATKKVVGSTGC